MTSFTSAANVLINQSRRYSARRISCSTWFRLISMLVISNGGGLAGSISGGRPAVIQASS
jgi:hypothetical protein